MSILTTRDNYSVSHTYMRASNADELALVRMLTVTCPSDFFIKIWDSENEWKNTKTLVGHEHSLSSLRSTLEPLRSLLCARISKGTVTPMYINHGTIAFPVIYVSLSAESRSSCRSASESSLLLLGLLMGHGRSRLRNKISHSRLTLGRHSTVQINAKAIDGNLKSVKP
jgi:hypothetical protein